MPRASGWLAAPLLPVSGLGVAAPDAATTVALERIVPLSPAGRLEVGAGVGPTPVSQIVFQDLPTERGVRGAEKPHDGSTNESFSLTYRLPNTWHIRAGDWPGVTRGHLVAHLRMQRRMGEGE